MATLLFAAVGSALAGSATAGASAGAIAFWGAVGTGVGAAVGGMVDQAVLYPAIFGKKGQSLTGPRLDDTQIFTASEGSPMTYLRGICRTAGTLIYCGPVDEVVHEETQGGGGGKGFGGGGGETTVRSFEYFATIAIGICEGQVAKLSKVWADSKLIYTGDGFRNLLRWSDAFNESAWTRRHCNIIWNSAPDPDGTRLADLLKPTATDAHCWQKRLTVTPNTQYTFSFYHLAGSTPVGPKYSVFDGSNDDYIVNPTTYTPGTTWARASVTFTTPASCRSIDVSVIDGCASTGDVWLYGSQLETGASATGYQQTLQVAPGSAPAFKSVTFYNGSETQLPDPLLEAELGAGNVPGYRGTSYIVFEQFNLTEYGNRIPQFNFEIIENKQKSIAGTITDLCTRAGFTDFDVSRVGAGRMPGFLISGPQVTASLLDQLITVFDLLVQETDGILVFFSRGRMLARTYTPVQDVMLAAREEGQDTPKRAIINDLAGFDLPSEVRLQYLDRDRQYQRGSTTEKRRLATADNVMSIDVPVAFDSLTARSIAKRLLWSAAAERQGLELMLTPDLLYLQEGDPIAVTINGEVYYARFTEYNRGNNFLIDAKAVVEYTKTLYTTSSSEDLLARRSDVVDYRPDDTVFFIADIPALRDEDTTQPGFYWGVCTKNRTSFRGVGLYSTPDGVEQRLLDTALSPASIGKTLVSFNAGVIDDWDSTNTIFVVMSYGTLESRTEDEVLNGANWIVVGDEIIGFQIANLYGENVYQLSTLLRGIRGTPSRNHASSEQVLVLNGAIRFVAITQGLVGQTRDLRAVSSGGIVEEFPSKTITFAGNTLRTLPSYDVSGARDGSNNLTVTWTATSRILEPPLAVPSGTSLPDEYESWEVDIMDGLTVVRTIASISESVVYTAAEQTADGLTPGDPVDVRVYRLSSIMGRGLTRTDTV